MRRRPCGSAVPTRVCLTGRHTFIACAKIVPSSAVVPRTTPSIHSSHSPRFNLAIESSVQTAPSAACGSSVSERPEKLCAAVCSERSAEAGVERSAARRAEGEEDEAMPSDERIEA